MSCYITWYNVTPFDVMLHRVMSCTCSPAMHSAQEHSIGVLHAVLCWLKWQNAYCPTHEPVWHNYCTRKSTANRTLSTEVMYNMYKKSHILVCEWDMKLGIVPLWSARKHLSNDVLKVDFNVGHIFAKNCTRPKAIIHGFTWFWVKIQLAAKWTSFECSIHADHNGANPSFISHS